MAKKQGWGFDVKELDAKVRPQDDFFHHVNKSWIDSHPIPAAESRWGSFIQLRYLTDKQLHTILNELQARKSVAKGSPEQMIRDLYHSGMDMKRRNQLGTKPLDSWRKKISSIKNQKDLLQIIAELHRIGVGGPWSAGVDQDAKNTDRYVL